MTADEMFQAIGYKKTDKYRGTIEYIQYNDFGQTLIIQIDRENQRVTAMMDGEIAHMEFDEILAAAELLKELEM